MAPSDDGSDAAASATSEERNPKSGPEGRLWRRRILFSAPIVLFGGLAIALGTGLTDKPRTLPSALLDKPVPPFSLPPVKGRTLGLSNEHFIGAPALLNVFASWCVACRAEHPLWMELKSKGSAALYGLNYKDQPENAASWLDELGDPYARTGADINGRVGIDWGVYGVPETFVVNSRGIIVHKHIGAVTRRDIEETIMPLMTRLQ